MRTVSFLLLLAAVLPGVRAQCYLENANALCSVCWKTVYTASDDMTGVTTMSECPMTITVAWDTPPPEEMFAGTSYPVEYSLKIDRAEHEVTLAAKKTTTISHANIHSCIASRGACTPFVANSPGLATHTEERTGNFDEKGLVAFTSDVELTAEVYTIIGHVRFYVPNDRDPTLPPTKMDAASGISRTVMPEITEVSEDSYVMTGCTPPPPPAAALSPTFFRLPVPTIRQPPIARNPPPPLPHPPCRPRTVCAHFPICSMSPVVWGVVATRHLTRGWSWLAGPWARCC